MAAKHRCSSVDKVRGSFVAGDTDRAIELQNLIATVRIKIGKDAIGGNASTILVPDRGIDVFRQTTKVRTHDLCRTGGKVVDGPEGQFYSRFDFQKPPPHLGLWSHIKIFVQVDAVQRCAFVKRRNTSNLEGVCSTCVSDFGVQHITKRATRCTHPYQVNKSTLLSLRQLSLFRKCPDQARYAQRCKQCGNSARDHHPEGPLLSLLGELELRLHKLIRRHLTPSCSRASRRYHRDHNSPAHSWIFPPLTRRAYQAALGSQMGAIYG